MTRSQRHNAYMRLYRPLKRVRGECAWCSLPALPGESLCRKHRDGLAARMGR